MAKTRKIEHSKPTLIDETWHGLQPIQYMNCWYMTYWSALNPSKTIDSVAVSFLTYDAWKLCMER